MEINSNDNVDFDTLYDRYAEQVYQTALHYSGNHHVAEEITQAVFMELCDCEENICLNNAEAWFYTLAKNKALDYQRSTKKEFTVESIFEQKDSIVHIERFDYMQGNCNMDDYYLEELKKANRSQFLEKIYDDLYEKNDRWYLAIMGAYVLQIPQKTVAKKLGISVGSLEMQLIRAKRWIRKRYQEEFERLEKE